MQEADCKLTGVGLEDLCKAVVVLEDVCKSIDCKIVVENLVDSKDDQTFELGSKVTSGKCAKNSKVVCSLFV